MRAFQRMIIAGNILFALWIIYNGINEGFRGTLPQTVSYLCLIALLAANSFLIKMKR